MRTIVKCDLHPDAGNRPTGECLECSRARCRDYYAKNKEKILARQKRNFQWTPEKLENRASWYEKSKESLKIKHKEYLNSRPDLKQKYKENQKVRYHLNPSYKLAYNAAWREKNMERMKELVKEWSDNNRHKIAKYLAARKARLLQATPSWANDFYIEEAYHLARVRTELFGFPWHVDHIVPLQGKKVCGLHYEQNMRVIPATINCSKGNRFNEAMLENLCVF